MKVVILAGGLGTRLAEHTGLIPKPMVEIGGYPMLWHIMNIYSYHGFEEFIIAGGYKVEIIKDYFLNYHILSSDFTVDISNGSIEVINKPTKNWKVSVIDTGKDSMTGGRLLRLKEILGDQPFLMTYGDGVSDVDITKLVAQHKKENNLITLTAVHPRAHYGELELENKKVVQFLEKPQFRQSWINGGFMVIDPAVFSYIDSDKTVFEQEPLEEAAKNNQLSAYKHDGFWQCMDTLRDVNYLNELWQSNDSPWATWR